MTRSGMCDPSLLQSTGDGVSRAHPANKSPIFHSLPLPTAMHSDALPRTPDPDICSPRAPSELSREITHGTPRSQGAGVGDLGGNSTSDLLVAHSIPLGITVRSDALRQTPGSEVFTPMTPPGSPREVTHGA